MVITLTQSKLQIIEKKNLLMNCGQTKRSCVEQEFVSHVFKDTTSMGAFPITSSLDLSQRPFQYLLTTSSLSAHYLTTTAPH